MKQAAGGLVRHIYLRHAVRTDRVMVCLVCTKARLGFEQAFCAALTAAHPQVRSVILNVNPAATNVILGRQCRTLWGEDTLADTLCGVPVRLSPLSFYQVNTLGAEQLYGEAARMAQLDSGDTLLDLYCGAGTIGLSMAAACRQLVGAEIVPEAVENARANATRMGAGNARFLCADAAEAAQQLLAEGLRPDVVVLDPPRKGCDETTLSTVASMGAAACCDGELQRRHRRARRRLAGRARLCPRGRASSGHVPAHKACRGRHPVFPGRHCKSSDTEKERCCNDKTTCAAARRPCGGGKPFQRDAGRAVLQPPDRAWRKAAQEFGLEPVFMPNSQKGLQTLSLHPGFGPKT